MNIKTLYSKLHNAICTESRLDYIGSVTIDQDWMEAAKIHEDQAVDVLNIDNGSRITTYAIAGERGSGVICLNGAAAHHFQPGDRVIIIAYCNITLEQKPNFHPRILIFSEHPPYEINQQERKLRWLKEIPQYSLLEKEKPATTYDNLDALPSLPPQCDRDELLAHNWKLGCQLLWNEAELVTGLEAFMRENHVEKLLDVSGGNGFPAIELRRRGWNVAYNDGSVWMKQKVETQIKQENEPFLQAMPCTQLAWQELDTVIPADSYDLIMCRGNSLPYAMSWSVNQVCSPEEAEKVIKQALAQFIKILRPGGTLLVDKSNFESSGFYVVEKQGIVDSEQCHIHWVFVNDVNSGIRRWDQYNTVGKQTTCLTLYSLLVTEEKLLEWLTEAGFVSICPTPLKGENIYTVYTARKPVGETTVAKTSDYYDHQNAIYRQVWDANGRICWGYYPETQPEIEFEQAGQKHIERMAQMITLDQNSKVLEIGCGNGVTAIWLAQQFGCQVVGLDPSPTNIKQAQTLAKEANITHLVTFVCATIQTTSFAEGEFTHIWSNAALSHIPERERQATFKEMRRILNSDGVLLFDDTISPTGKVDAHAQEWVYDRLHYDKLYNPTEYTNLLESVGFKVEKVDDLTIHQQKSYQILSDRADKAGYARLSKAYRESSQASAWGTLGWMIFMAKAEK